MVTRKLSRKTLISDHISDDIPPQMEIVNMFIPLQFCLKLERFMLYKTACRPMKRDVI